MTNTETYSHFFQTVRDSIASKTFAKLTLAKTIGKPELQNIYIRIATENGKLKLSVTHKIYQEGLQEIEKIVDLEQLEAETVPYFYNPFLTALLFTTEADITLKHNKKRVANITEQAPTFKHPDAVLLELE